MADAGDGDTSSVSSDDALFGALDLGDADFSGELPPSVPSASTRKPHPQNPRSRPAPSTTNGAASAKTGGSVPTHAQAKAKVKAEAPMTAVHASTEDGAESIDRGTGVNNLAVAKGADAGADAGAGADTRWEGGVVDADDVMERLAEEGWAAALAAGTMTEADVAHARRLRKLKEEVSMCKHMEKMSLPPAEDEAVMLRLSRAHVALRNTWLAIEALRRGLQRLPESSRMRIQLSKLLFRDDQKELAVQECIQLTEAYAADLAAGRISQPSPGSMAVTRASEEEVKAPTHDDSADLCRPDTAAEAAAQRVQAVADAYYIMGWAQIHAGDHSAGYAVWRRGHEQVPSDARLAKQYAKRHCWDVVNGEGEGEDDDDDERELSQFVGAGAHADGAFDVAADVDAFAVVDSAAATEVALKLFVDEHQQRNVVFRSRNALLTPAECSAVLGEAHAHAAAKGGWGTVRHSSVPTTDVAVEDLPRLRPWLRELMRTRLRPMLAACYPALAAEPYDLGPGGARVRVHDAFIVRYDAVKDGSLELPAHSDTSALSVTLPLDGSGEDDEAFTGGGTWFRALGEHNRGRVINAPAGHAVVFAGPLWHMGWPIRSGTRHILVMFLYVEGFNYGKLIGFDKQEACDHAAGQGGDSKARSFVVYNETHKLLTTLDS